MKYTLKYIGIYLLLLVLISFFTSLLNLIGLNYTITGLLLFIFNISLFLYYGFKFGKKSKDKGYLAGLKISLLLIILLFIVNLLVRQNPFNITTLIYYLVLILSGILGGMIGINKKKED